MIRLLFAGAVLGTGLFVEFAQADEIKIGAEQVIAAGPTLTQPRVAFGDGVYFVVWQEGSAGVDSTSDIRGIRLRADTLEPLDRQPLQLAAAIKTEEAPAVAYADGVFLVATQDFRNGKHYLVQAMPVDARTGVIFDEKSRLPAAVKRNQLRPAIASDGKTLFIVWQEMGERDTFGIRGMRVSRDNLILDGKAIEIAASGTSPTISISGGKVLVAWTNRDRNQSSTSSALLDLKTGKKLKDLSKINTCCGDAPASAGDGDGGFVTVAARAGNPDPWGWGGPGAVVLSRVLADGIAPESKLNYAYRLSNLCWRSVPNVVDAAVWKGSKTWDAGAVGGFPGTQDGLWPTGSPSVVHASKGLYLFAWVKGTLAKDKLTVRNFDIWVRGMDAKSLAVRIPDQKAAGDAGADETQPHLAAGRAGEVLLSYVKVQAGERRRVVVRRLTIANKAE